MRGARSALPSFLTTRLRTDTAWRRTQLSGLHRCNFGQEHAPSLTGVRRNTMVMKIHFLNVGHGDCTFIELPSGRLMMIDINNSKSLPEADIEALAESKGMSKMTFKSIQLIEGKFRSWEEYYKALLVDPADYYNEHF